MSSEQEGWTQSEALDFDKVSTEKPPPLDDGYYQATIVEAKPQKTQEGVPGVSIELRVDRSYESPLETPRKMFDRLVFTKAALWHVKQIAVAANVSPPKSTAFGDVEEFCEALTGTQVWLRSEKNTYKGKVNARAAQFYPEDKIADAVAGKGESNGAAESSTGVAKKRRRAA